MSKHSTFPFKAIYFKESSVLCEYLTLFNHKSHNHKNHNLIIKVVA